MTEIKNRLDMLRFRLTMCHNLDSMLPVLRREARAMIGSDGVSIVLRERDLCFYADEDAIGPLWKGRRFPMSICISGWSMLNRKLVSIPDIYQDPRIPLDAYRPTFVRSLVMAPIRTDEPIGALGAYWANKRTPTDQEITQVQALAEVMAEGLIRVRH